MGSGRDPRPGSPYRIAVAERRAKAVQMRSAGYSYEAIARELGHRTASAACQDVQRYLAASARESTEDLRTLQLRRLDLLWQQVMAVMRRDHFVISGGGIVTNDEGRPLKDDGPILSAVDRLLKIMERQARITGSDAPIRAEVLTLSAIEAEIARLTDELTTNDPAPQPGRTEADPTPATAGPATPA